MSSMKDFSSKKTKLIILILFFAFVSRLGLAYFLKDTFFFRGNRYSIINEIAQNIINYGEFSLGPNSPTSIHEPLYPLFVAFSYYIFGKNWLTITIFQSIISLLNGLILYFISLKIFGDAKVSTISLFLFCFYPYYVSQTISISDTTIFCFLLGLSTFILIKYTTRDIHFFKNFLVGSLWGLTLLTRFSAISIFPIVMIYIFLNVPFKKALKISVIVLIGFLTTLMPWISRNYHLSRNLFVTTHGAIELWFGYNKDTHYIIKNDLSVDLMRKDIEKKIPDLKTIRKESYQNPVIREVKESRAFLKSAIDFAINNSLQCIKLMPLKFWKFWSWHLNPRPETKYPIEILNTNIIYTLSYLPILSLGLFGIIWLRRSWKKLSIFLAIFSGYSLLHSVVYGFSRLRIPIDQFLFIYASYSAVYLYKKVSNFYK
jgi:4-amino-4-deoxy-L-arabinose transferase-like glycosyltransferase